MARRLGIPVRTWYNYEAGVTVPAEVILKIIELTSIEPSWLLHGKGPKFRQGVPERRESASPPMTVGALLRTALQILEGQGSTAGGAAAADEAIIRPPTANGGDTHGGLTPAIEDEGTDVRQRRRCACGPRGRPRPGRRAGNGSPPAARAVASTSSATRWCPSWPTARPWPIPPRRRTPANSTTNWSSSGSRGNPWSAGSSIAAATPCSAPRTPTPSPRSRSSTWRITNIRPASAGSCGSIRLTEGYQLRNSPAQGKTRILPSPIRPVRAWPTMALMAAPAAASSTKTHSSTLGTKDVLYSLPRY